MPGGRRDRSDPADRPGPAGRDGGAGWTVPGYSHVRELGAGRSGRVVLAVDDVTQTPVAIKYLRAEDVASRDRLAAAAGTLSWLEDPNLVQFYEYAESPNENGDIGGGNGGGGNNGGGAAIVTEYVDGISLRRLLAAEGGVGPEAALSVLSGSLLALAALHGAGLAHGAYKPENVLIAADGTTKLGDAGVGSAPRYRPPEEGPSPAADLFAATTVFVECLSGAHAVPEQFRAIVAAGLSIDPGRRPSSAAAFLTELDEVASAAYGPSWEPTGRAGLAEHAARAAAGGEPPASRSRAPEAEPAADEPAAARPAPRPADFRRRRPYESAQYETAPYETAQYETAQYETAQYETAPHEEEAAPHESLPYDTAPSEPGAYEPAENETPGYETRTYDPAGYESDPFGPAEYETPRHGPAAPYDATGAADAGKRRTTRWSRTGVLVAVGAGAAVVLAAGATWYVLSSRGSPDSAANAQATSSTPATGQPKPPARPAELARAISKAVAARRTATFTYRAAGVAAQGTLKFAAGSATAYDMNVTPLAGAHPDRRHPVSRVILIGNRAYVARADWQAYPVASNKQPGGQGRLYATLAADTRQSSSVYDILALLRSSPKVRRNGLTYRGVAVASKLVRERTVADLYARAPRGAVVAFTLEMAQNLLPRQLTVTIKAPGGRQRTFRTTYTGWGHGPPIVPPH